MKQMITCFLLVCLSVVDIHAQVCPPKPAENNSCEPETSTDYVATPNPPADLDNLDGLIDKRKSVVRFGYGVNNILRIDRSQSGNWLSDDLSWFNDRPGHVFDLSVGIGKRSEWLLGFSFSFQKLGEMSRSATYLPGSSSQEQSDFGNLPLDVKFEQKATIYAPLIYTEYQILKPWKGFSVFGRMEMGMTIYRAFSELSYKDSCDCEVVPVSEWDMSTAFTAGLGLGVKWEYQFIRVKALISYQGQTKVSFKRKEDYAAYSFDFDVSDYDFRGGPERNRFTIQKSGEDVLRRYNPLYLQVMIYFRIGAN